MNLSVYFVTPDGADDELILQAIRGGVSMIQLRDKSVSDAEMIAQVHRLLPAMQKAGVPLVINDRIDVALATGAQGVHIGQSDGDVAQIRKTIGPDLLLGLSIETAIQLAQMPAKDVDYIGAGPVRQTASKPDHAAPIGFEGLATIVRKSPLPTVAIGGLTGADIPLLKEVGCVGLAVVSAISGAPDPSAAARDLRQKWGAA